MPTEHQSNERMMVRWTRRLGIFTIILAIISGVTAYILYQTDQTSWLRDRAFIYFGDPPVIAYPPDNPIVWGVGVFISNAGNMPARRLTIRYACPDSPRSEHVSDPFSLAKWNGVEVGSVVGPKQGFSLQGCNVPIEKINDAKKGLRDVFYVSEVKYIDGFDLKTLRVTQVSRIFSLRSVGRTKFGFCRAA